jgi:Acetyltransferase (GNAT) domain
VRYGADFAFLGCYIARPKVRGKGYGIKIWRAGMKLAAGRNVGLDGVPAQQANYQKSGFRLAWNNVRYEGAAPTGVKPPAGVTLVDARGVPFDKLSAYDRRFFPAARESFLERAALVALKDGELAGFGVIRAGAGSSRIGPLYAATPAIASALVSALGEAMPKDAAGAAVAIDVPEPNKAAVALVDGLAFKSAFATARMYTGADPPCEMAGFYSVTSFELG